jgi:CDP-diglyceride synthetase
MWKTYGIMGGWITAAIVISICWYMNHWMGVIWNSPGRIWVDQGWAVAASGVAWAMVRFNAQFLHALPTIFCCLLGGALAGLTATRVKRHLPAFAPPSQTRRSQD